MTRRILFYTQGTQVPAARFRGTQILPGLRAAGFHCTEAPATPSVYGDYPHPWIYGWRRGFTRPFSLVSRLRQLGAVRDHDLVVLQRPMVEYLTTVFEEIVTRARPTVFDFDDPIFFNKLGLERVKIRRLIDLSTHVVVGNDFLAEFANRPEKTTIIPTVVDTDRYRPIVPPEGQFTIGWTGSYANLVDIKPIVPVLKEVLAAHHGRLLVVCDHREPWLSELPVTFVRWTPQAEVTALAGMHVGIMHLPDIPYNYGKCGFKLVQYMASGIPVVASPFGANTKIVRHEIDGFHAYSQDEWREALLTLARDADLRQRMARSGREHIVENYSLKAVLPRYVELFSRL